MSKAKLELYELSKECQEKTEKTLIGSIRGSNVPIAIQGKLCAIVSQLIQEVINEKEHPVQANEEKIKSVLLCEMFDHRECPNCKERFIPNDITAKETRELYGELFGRNST